MSKTNQENLSNRQDRYVSIADLTSTPLPDRPLCVVAYIRVSTDKKNQDNSYDTQKQYFYNLLSRYPQNISGGIYSDYAVSGTCEHGRSGFNALLRKCREGGIDRIICKSISRFSRNTTVFLRTLDMLHKMGISVYFEKENIDTAIPVNSFVLTVLAAVAQEESRSISENIKWSIRKRYPTGEVPNEPIYGYRKCENEYSIIGNGYRYKKILPVPQEAAVIRRIFTEVSNGKKYIEIARELNAEQIPPPKRHGNKRTKNRLPKKGELKDGIYEGWTGRHISNIVKNERYTGDVLTQKTYTIDYLSHKVIANNGVLPQYLIKYHHPPIISRELFKKVQLIRINNSLRYGHNKNGSLKRCNFSSLFICSKCGRYYNVRNSSKNPIWFCPSVSRNNGIKICTAHKLYQKQAVKILKKASENKFGAENTEQSIKKFLSDYTPTRNMCENNYTEKDRLLEAFNSSTSPALSEIIDNYIHAVVLSVTIADSRYSVEWVDGSSTVIQDN